MKRMIPKILTLATAAAVFVLILTASISLPIYIRPFYYAHIDSMGLAESSGFTREEIVQAYDQVLDYLTIPGRDFGTGVMAYSENGRAHFADCRGLFFLNGALLVGSVLALTLLGFVKKQTKPEQWRIRGRTGGFWGAWAALVLPVVIGGLAALDFDRAFVIFHSLFFPGKDNWIFDYYADQIIRVLPQDFFMHCAMLIGGGVLCFAGATLAVNRIRGRKERE